LRECIRARTQAPNPGTALHRALCCALVLSLLCCAPKLRTGIMAGHMEARGAAPVELTFGFESGTWSHEGGTIHTVFPDGERFSGNYLRLADGTSEKWIQPIYMGWTQPVWGSVGFGPNGAWDYAGAAAPMLEWKRNYTGKVVASLSGNRGHEIRCQLHVDDPDAGLLGGGRGHCQVSTGAVIEVGI